MSNTETFSPVSSFESVTALREGLDAKANFDPVNLYPRDGSELLGEIEESVSVLAGTDQENLLVYNSGMSAVTDAVDTALMYSGKSSPTLACARELYSQSQRYVQNFLGKQGVKIVYFDSGDNDAIEETIKRQKPDVVFGETIGNFVNVPVMDLDFVRRQSEDLGAVAVIDNTLPLSTSQPIGDTLKDNEKLIVVESGTKSYSFNRELLGVAYTNNDELRSMLQRYRRTRGSLPSASSLEIIGGILPESRKDFDERNRRLFKSTADIAIALATAKPDDSGFVISHPISKDHDNHHYYSSAYPGNASPVFYIQSSRHNQYEVAERLWARSDVRDQAKLGQSFGFDHARIVADENVGAVRIAGGSETDGIAFGKVCAEALYLD